MEPATLIALVTAIGAALVSIITQLQHSKCTTIKISDCCYIERDLTYDDA